MEERRILEWGLLLGGVLLVVCAAAFVWLLPEEPPQTPQFTVRFLETGLDVPLPAANLSEGATDLTFTVAQGNVTRVEVLLGLADDLPASDPDQLRVELVSPNGTVVGAPVEAATDLSHMDGQTPPSYVATQRLVAVNARFADRPSAQIIDAEGRDETAPEAAARVAATTSTGGAGAWTLRITLSAGDCPTPDVDPPRAASCRQARPDGTDPGNPLQVLSLRTFHFSAEVQSRDV